MVDSIMVRRMAFILRNLCVKHVVKLIAFCVIIIIVLVFIYVYKHGEDMGNDNKQHEMEMVEVTDYPHCPPDLIIDGTEIHPFTYLWLMNDVVKDYVPKKPSLADTVIIRRGSIADGDLMIGSDIIPVSVNYKYHVGMNENGTPLSTSHMIMCSHGNDSACRIIGNDSSVGIAIEVPEEATAVTVNAHYALPYNQYEQHDGFMNTVSWVFRLQ